MTEFDAPRDVVQLLRLTSQDKANALVAAFAAASLEHASSWADAAWAVAMLQAKLLAMAPMGNDQVWAAANFSELVQIALPAAMLAQRDAEGTG
jgi:hypothetical protein